MHNLLIENAMTGGLCDGWWGGGNIKEIQNKTSWAYFFVAGDGINIWFMAIY